MGYQVIGGQIVAPAEVERDFLKEENQKLKDTIRAYQIAKVNTVAAGVYAKAKCIELKFDDGTAKTAIDVTRARVKPEPWISSVDDYDLLPDV